jgi:hypothetical protein
VFGIGHAPEEDRAVGGVLGDRSLTGEQDPRTAVLGTQAVQPGEVRGVGDEDRGAAVLEEVGEFRGGGPGIEGTPIAPALTVARTLSTISTRLPRQIATRSPRRRPARARWAASRPVRRSNSP